MMDRGFEKPSIRNLIRQTPWWVVSIVIHSILLGLLALISFGAAPPPREDIQIETEIVELEELKEQQNTLVRDNFEESSQEGSFDEGPAPADKVAMVREDAPLNTVEELSVDMIEKPVQKGELDDFDDPGQLSGDGLGRLRQVRPRNYEEAIDDFTLEITNALEKGPLLVIFLFDESKSIVDDRKTIVKRIELVIKNLNKDLSGEKLDNLRWAVASFGKNAKLWLPPTDDTDKLKKAINDIKEDVTGIENCIAAIRYCLQRVKAPDDTKRFIVLITDETGDDTKVGNSKMIESTLNALRRENVSLYAFSREAMFSREITYEAYIDPEGNRFVGAVDRGPESAYPEYFNTDGLFTVAETIRSGFGLYIQSRLASATNGKYYLIDTEKTPYDIETLAFYEPELCSRSIYRSRTTKSPMRRTLRRIVKEWDQHKPDRSLRQLGRLNELIPIQFGKVRNSLDFCNGAIQALEKFKGRKEKYQPKRWEANYDLILAQLYKFKFLLRQYAGVLEALQKGKVQKPDSKKKVTGITVVYNDKSTKFIGGEGAKKDYEKAVAMLELVKSKHPNTPWAIIAEQEKNGIKPLEIRYDYYRPSVPKRPSKKGKGGKPQVPIRL